MSGREVTYALEMGSPTALSAAIFTAWTISGYAAQRQRLPDR